MSIVIFDLDGCLSDDRHRIDLLPEVASNQADFSPYHDLFVADEPINIEVVKEYADAGHTIVFSTARPSEYSNGTVGWIEAKLGIQDFELLMRPSGDHNLSPLVKVSQFELGFGKESWGKVIAAFDDREDVLHLYKEKAPHCECRILSYPKDSVESVLEEMSKTQRERNQTYKDSYKRISKIMAILFPNGVKPELLGSEEWHLFEMTVAKLARFATSEFTHADSIHDAAVYAVLIQSELQKKGIK